MNAKFSGEVLDDVRVLTHSSIRIEDKKTNSVMYFDPYEMKNSPLDADIVFITHDHFDHFSDDDVVKVLNSKTEIVLPASCAKSFFDSVSAKALSEEKVHFVMPNEKYCVKGVKFSTVFAYNKDKDFHKRENRWVGYIVEANGVLYYVAGDTDCADSTSKIVCDVALVPVGGTYTFDVDEAVEFVKMISPAVAVPTHFGSVAGDYSMGEEFVEKVSKYVDYAEDLMNQNRHRNNNNQNRHRNEDSQNHHSNDDSQNRHRNESGCISAAREQIDQIDSDILSLLNERANLSLQIRQAKKAKNEPLYSPKREEEVIDALCAKNEGPLYNEDVRNLFGYIMRTMRGLPDD